MSKKKQLDADIKQANEVMAGEAKDKKPSLNLKEIALGSLVGSVRDVNVEFWHLGVLESVDVFIEQLSYTVTDPMLKRLNEGDASVAAEWIALAVVDEDGKHYLTEATIAKTFTQSLLNAMLFAVTGLDLAVKAVQPGKTL